jgi:hypothetical protein
MDPLAVLMSSVWTTKVGDDDLAAHFAQLKNDFEGLRSSDARPLDSEDEETRGFMQFWFADAQRTDLRKVAGLLAEYRRSASSASDHAVLNVMSLALSRIIVTKDRGASLARDVSHSRPHKVADASDYDVFKGYERALGSIRGRLQAEPPAGGVSVGLGDARNMSSIGNDTVDAVLTSPPYLNAIDYLRGHRLALVWLGYSIRQLRDIRSDSIGSERRPTSASGSDAFVAGKAAMGELAALPARFQGMIDRYVQDLVRLLVETRRVLRVGARATFVVGNSCLRGVFIDNSAAITAAATAAGLEFVDREERQLPATSRYLPLTSPTLQKRMRSEVILTLKKPSTVG